ncbi:HTH-type transcriptional repressor PurR [Clostridia bacterium]|nr:HTH-type transcriptional repressor PurR [Clostridia bacterium]
MSTMRDIARLANVSVATVSRVINNDKTYRMRQETHDRVWKAIAQTNYQIPLPRAEMVRDGKRENRRVGCVLSIVKGKYRDPYFMSILSGIEARFAHYGYSLDFLRTYAELKNRSVLREVLENPPDALILMDTLDPALCRALRAKIPVCVGVDTQIEDIDNVGYDQFFTAKSAVETLIARGHREIAFIGGSPTEDLRDSGRYMGYRYAMQEAALPMPEGWACHCHWDELACMAQVHEMMNQPTRPTAIFAASDLMAIAVLSALYSMGISVPGQVAVIGITNIELARFSSPPLTTFEIPAYEIGLVAADLIHSRLNEGFPLPRRILLPTQLVLRESV